MTRATEAWFDQWPSSEASEMIRLSQGRVEAVGGSGTLDIAVLVVCCGGYIRGSC